MPAQQLTGASPQSVQPAMATASQWPTISYIAQLSTMPEKLFVTASVKEVSTWQSYSP